MDLKSFPIEDQRKFIHEAAHAVMALHQKIEIEAVWVDLAAEPEHRRNKKLKIISDNEQVNDPYACKRKDLGDPDKNTEEGFELHWKMAIYTRAGYIAESFYLDGVELFPEGKGDFDSFCYHIWACTKGPLSSRKSKFSALKESTDRRVAASVLGKEASKSCSEIVNLEWFRESVFTLAEELTTRVRMTGEEVKALLAD
ncbi:hypothetical protein [Oceanospirillum beijerinckii]|uniref:hypothetical protein n=1 Tax=Oceanospirillum beijerinckii TaxID=64976 RepID=UPI000480EEB6|nr:hypothetical protein [Oceanospirillum beijerinckii]